MNKQRNKQKKRCFGIGIFQGDRNQEKKIGTHSEMCVMYDLSAIAPII